MKLGEGGEAFFVFETSDRIPPGLQTSPLVSPVASPESNPSETAPNTVLLEPEPLDLAGVGHLQPRGTDGGYIGSSIERPKSVNGVLICQSCQ
jgi:phosphatidate phosphatase LPIN